MEKFGIFELLDTLSAVMQGTDEQNAAPDGGPQRPNAGDPAFIPPRYPAANEEDGKETQAVRSLLTRHDEIVKRIDRKK